MARIGIITLDESGEDENYYYFTNAIPDDEEWLAFVQRSNALLKSSRKSHADLILAVIRYMKIDPKLPERKEHEETIKAFMGEDFNLKALGKWERIQSLHEFNRKSIEEEFVQTYVFVYSLHEDDI
jgi:hypothetical protein